jgi:hypothetical protein
MTPVNSAITMTRKLAKKNIFRMLNVFFASGLDGVNIKVNTRKLTILTIRYVLRSSFWKKARKVFTRQEINMRKNIYLLFDITVTPR